MDTSELLERTGFHDASISILSMSGNQVCLRFENVLLDEDCYSVTLALGGVRSVTRNSEAVDALRPEGEGSSVIDFERSGNSAVLAVDWRSYTARTNETCSYRFAFDSFDLQAEKQM